MSKTTKFIFGSAVTLVLLLLAGALFLRHLVTKSYPVTRGTIVIAGLHGTVDVYRDNYGVPHVRATDEHDLAFAAGYVHAQDRLWQMDLMRRAGEGRLSEILGGPTVATDKLFRTIGLSGVAAKMKEHLHPESRRLLEAYADGVNSFITTHEGNFSIEFDMLNYRPEPWTVEHSLLIARLIAWELNLAWWTDLAYGEIASQVSPEKLQEILPAFPDSIPVTVPSSMPKASATDLHGVLDAARSYRAMFGLGSLEAGSNAWVVDSSKSLNGKPMLANDPHLAMPQPSRWYEIHLSSSDGWNVAGVSLPGAPVVIIGHNDRIAWGLTNAMIDDADFFVEQADTSHPNHYIFQGLSVAMDVREENIAVRSSDTVTITVRTSRHGPIVSDVHPAYTHRQDSTRQPLHPLIAMRWTGMEVSDELYGFRLMNKAENARQFEEGLKEITVPGQSVVYADVNGNIAYWTTGRVPIRSGHGNPMLPLSGRTDDDDWRGFVPFDQMPKLLNPPEGIIICANQKIADRSFPYYLSTLWEPPSRLLRIRELLHSAEKFTADDFKQFQQDLVSPFAHDVTMNLLHAFDTVETNDPILTGALNYIHNWDFRFTPNDIATTVFNEFLVRLLRNTYVDEMGEDVFKDFVFYGAIPTRVTSQLLARDSSAWFDDVTTPLVVETKNDIIRKSFTDAVHVLQSKFGNETKTWQWGSIHTVTFKHPFGSRKPLDRVFNVGPFAIGGGGTTVNKAEYRFAFPYDVSVGPSMRQVIDLQYPLAAYTVITSGQSGQPLQKHYDDQSSLWLNGGYKRATTDWNEIRKERMEHLVLKP